MREDETNLPYGDQQKLIELRNRQASARAKLEMRLAEFNDAWSRLGGALEKAKDAYEGLGLEIDSVLERLGGEYIDNGLSEDSPLAERLLNERTQIPNLGYDFDEPLVDPEHWLEVFDYNDRLLGSLIDGDPEADLDGDDEEDDLDDDTEDEEDDEDEE